MTINLTIVNQQELTDVGFVKHTNISNKSRPYHFVSKCNHSWIKEESLKGLIQEIDQKQPYFVNNEIGTTNVGILYGDHNNDKQGEHWHLFFYSTKSINTVKKMLTDKGFLNLKYSNPNNEKYDKYKILKDSEPCIIYLSKGVTNHMKTTDDLEVQPIVRLTNLTTEERLVYRKEYERIILEMKKKTSDFKKNIKDKKISDTKKIVQYMEGKEPEEILESMPDFFLENIEIHDSNFKYEQYFILCLRNLHPQIYKKFRINYLRQRFENYIF